jgi:gliding motility-associated-like protein
MKQKPAPGLFLFLLFVLCLSGAAIGTPHSEHIGTPHIASGLIKFTENRNQWEKQVLYRAQLDGGVLFLEKNCFTYSFYDKDALRKNHIGQSGTQGRSLQPSGTHNTAFDIRSHAFRMTFINSSTYVETLAKQKTEDYCNFYIGQDKSKWASYVGNYKEVYYKNIYSGIDLEVLGMENSVKYNFIVAPHAVAKNIALFYEGLDGMELRDGALVLKTSLNQIVEQKPYAYQWMNGKQVEVPCEFVLKNKTVSFRFPKGYDKNLELIIDPILVFAASSGSTADNFGMTATYDDQGCLYAGGTCFSQGYPITTGAFDVTYNGIMAGGRTDVAITKYNPAGTALIYSTYLGGATSTEIISSIIVNSQNELMVYGATGSSDFPVTTGAYDTTFNGGSFLSFSSNGTEYANGTDLYVTKFNNAGTSLLGSTYVGGSNNDGANSSGTLLYNYGDYYRGEIQVDNAGNCYVASCTYSTDFPTTSGCPQPNAGGGMDGVVFKLTPGLTALTWSTYLGGSSDDGCYALTFDNFFNVYATGGTASSNFPATAGTLGSIYKGGFTDGFITKINSSGTSILHSTFIGTGSYDQSFLIQFDVDYDLYIIGQTEGVMPVSPGVYSNANSKQFIWKIDSTLSTTIFTTNFGNGSGQVNISPSAFLVDGCGNIFVCGWGGNILTGIPTTNMPLTSNALQPSTDGFNFYLFVLAPDAASLLYGTYFGGGQSWEHVDGGTSRFDKKGIVYQAVCSGCGGYDDFPVTPGAWPNLGSNVNQSFNCNEGVFKFDFQATGASAHLVSEPNDTICAGSAVDFNNTSVNAFNYIWDFGDGSAQSIVVSPSHVYSAPGNYDVTLVAIDSSGCIFADTAHLTVVVIPPPSIDLGADILLCQSPSELLDAGTSGFIYLWSTGETSQTITASATGDYWATIGNGACSVSDTISIVQAAEPQLGDDTVLCEGQTIVLEPPSGALSYQWSTGSTVQNIIVTSGGQYHVTVNWGPCQTRDTINIAYTSYPSNVNLPSSANLCPGDSIELDPGTNAGASFLWSTGEQTQVIYINSGGVYTVQVSNQNCSVWDTININGLSPIPVSNYVSMCNVDEYTLDAGPGALSYLWSTGATTQTITITNSGTYWITIVTPLCVLSDTILVEGSFESGALWVPNSFTPNNDLLNDTFVLKGTDITEFHLVVFNRWGEVIFESKDMGKPWDGTIKGKMAEQGVYVWKVKYKTLCSKDAQLSRSGHVSVIR